MRKKIIALAMAGLAGSALAQSSVTLYGVADATFERSQATGATGYRNGYQLNIGNPAPLAAPMVGGNNVFSNFQPDYNNARSQTRLTNNTSYLGLKGEEDLGNGLKTFFQFESGADFTGDGGSLAFSRDSYFGLSGSFGTVISGNFTHPIKTMGAKVDFNPGTTSAGFAGLYGEFLGVKTGTEDRAKNAVAYVTPSFSGLTGIVAYVSSGISPAADNGNTDALNALQNGQRVCQYTAGGQATSCAANSSTTLTPILPANPSGTVGLSNAGAPHSQQWQLAARYENGPLWVSGGYHHAQDPRAGAAILGALTGASADTSWERLAAQYNNLNFTNNAGVGSGGLIAGFNTPGAGIANGATVNGVTYPSVNQASLNAIRANQVALLNTNTYRDSLNVWRVAGRYDFPTGTSISALYDWQKYKFSNAGTYVAHYTYNTAGQITGLAATGTVQNLDGSARRSAWMLGINQNFGRINTWLQYTRANNIKGDLADAAGLESRASGANQLTVGASYGFSKRAILHGFYTAVTNKSMAAYDSYVGASQNSNSSTQAGADTRIVGAGLRFTF